MNRQTIDTRLARVIRTAPDRVEVRFREGCKLDTAGISEILELRRKLGEHLPLKVMGVIPDDADFEMDMLTKDHYAVHGTKDYTAAVAWVAQGSLQNQMTNLYLSYHPTPFRSAVFTDEADAQRWLDEQGMDA
jgi:hypothetical protein